MRWGLPDPAPFLLDEDCRHFHDQVRAGDIDGMQKLLEIEPDLVHARNENRETSLMVATVLPDTDQAVQMVGFLIHQGAYLGSHDARRRHALLHACRHGVERAVVDILLTENARRGGKKFQFHDCDTDGHSAVVLASKTANTSVTTLLLDNINIASQAKWNHPFKVLKMAIDSGDHQHALAIALHEKIQASFEDPEITRYKGSGKPDSLYTIATCTKAAVKQGMLDLVQVLYMANRPKVSRAVWHIVHKLFNQGVDLSTAVPPVLRRIGQKFTKIWRWRHVRVVCLAHFGRCEDSNEERENLLARLPDDVFLRVISFVIPSAFVHPSDFELRWCRCLNVSALGVCRWHNCYRAKRSDYDRVFNPNIANDDKMA